MSTAVMYAANLVAICVLVFAVFVPRHGRRELIVAYLGVNVGVLAVAAALATSTIGAGLGLGLFGVLSIIRLRSEELAQHEVAYYFAALALGLIGGLSVTPTPLHLGLMVAIVLAVYLGDHPRLARRTTRHELLLDHAVTDPGAVHDHVSGLLGAGVVSVTVVKTDLVNDTTLVTVRLDESARRATTASGPAAPAPAPAVSETRPDAVVLEPRPAPEAAVVREPADETPVRNGHRLTGTRLTTGSNR